MQPPATTQYSFREKDAGTGVFSLQKGLNSTNLFAPLVEDGAFGPRTAAVVRSFQDLRKITADGIAGPTTQTHLAQYLIRQVEAGLPGGLLLSIVEGESGALIAAVNWSVSGGVDCGYVQRRVLGPPFDDAAVRRAFDSLYQFKLTRSHLIETYTKYHGDSVNHPATYGRAEYAWRVSVYSHNNPSGADRLSRTPIKDLSSYWTQPQDWVTNIGAKFPDGVAIKTPLEWAQHYSLGNSAHGDPGAMVKYVTDWT